VTRKDWTLLAIRAARRGGLSPVQLQKTLFLLGKEIPEQVGTQFYNFKPYNYGPFDQAVYADADRLSAEGYVDIVQRSGESWKTYTITRDGEIKASYLDLEAGEVRSYVDQLVEWVQQQNFQQLVRAIYAKYPEMRANSVFQG